MPGSVSKHFLASAIVSGFGVCRWDGSQGGVVSRWPFLQSLFHFFVPVFPLDRNNSELKFFRWVDGPIPQLGAMHNYWKWNLQVLSPLCWVFQLLSSPLSAVNPLTLEIVHSLDTLDCKGEKLQDKLAPAHKR
jgi:hypothetical protein